MDIGEGDINYTEKVELRRKAVSKQAEAEKNAAHSQQQHPYIEDELGTEGDIYVTCTHYSGQYLSKYFIKNE